MEWIAALAGANAILALALTALAAKAWFAHRDRRAAWMSASMASLLALAGVVVVQAWTTPLGTVWAWIAGMEAAALASLYIGALR